MDKKQLTVNIIKFAAENKLHIHPGQKADTWAALVITKDGCPCVPGRKACPCPESLKDIQELNRCRCGLFCNDAYLKEYNSLITQRKNKR